MTCSRPAGPFRGKQPVEKQRPACIEAIPTDFSPQSRGRLFRPGEPAGCHGPGHCAGAAWTRPILQTRSVAHRQSAVPFRLMKMTRRCSDGNGGATQVHALLPGCARGAMTAILATLAFGFALSFVGTAHASQAAADSFPMHRLFPLPFAFYQPETHFGGGLGLLHTIRTSPESKTSSDGAFLVVTERKQFSILFSTERYLRGDRYRLFVETIGSRFPDYFYGTGNATVDEEEESFTPETAKGSIDLRTRVRPDVYAGLTWRYQRTDVTDTEVDGLLRSKSVRGSGGGTLLGPGAVISMDTRDRVFNATRGAFLTGGAGFVDPAFGADFSYSRFECDARMYRQLGSRGSGRPIVVAVQSVITTTAGSPPFFDLATLGGANVLRGVYEGRFRDRQRAVGQVELRVPLWWRIGTGVFLGAGQVANQWSAFRLSDLHVTGGGGVRILLSETEGVMLRLDMGIHEDGSGVYFALGDAF